MRVPAFILTVWFLGSGLAATAQPVDPDLPVFYTIERGIALYHASDSTREYLHLRYREPLQMIEPGAHWSRVRTMDGANGMVRTESISNVWIRISKKSQTLFVYRGSSLVARFAADLGYNFFADKERRGSASEPDHWRTPEGEFYVAAKNPNSAFYRALVLNYPNAEDAERGKRSGVITGDEFDAIVRAERSFAMPPMNTGLGGYIEIHGDGTGFRRNWTQGCIAVQNDQIDRLWSMVVIGTPVLIEP